MSKYKVQVVMSYWQTIEVEANNKDEAADIAYDSFDETKPMRMGEGEVYGVELIGEEG